MPQVTAAKIGLLASVYGWRARVAASLPLITAKVAGPGRLLPANQGQQDDRWIGDRRRSGLPHRTAGTGDAVDAPRRHLRAKVTVSNCQRKRRPRSRLPRSVWTSRSTCSRCMEPRVPGMCCSGSSHPCEAARQTPCVVAIEACAGAHYWAREIASMNALGRQWPGEFAGRLLD